MRFDKCKFREFASKGVQKTLACHLETLDGKTIRDIDDSGNGTIDYEFEGEEYSLYPVSLEWCVEEKKRNE